LSGSQQGSDRLKELAVGHLTSELSPEHFNRIEPRAVGWQVQQDKATRRTAHDGFNFIVLMCDGVIPGNEDRSRWMLV
jgi:hypothetical protein